MARERDTRVHIRIPLDLLGRADISSDAKVMFGLLKFRGDGNDVWVGSMRSLAVEMGLNFRTVRKVAEELVKAGLLDLAVVPAGRGGCQTRFSLLVGGTAPIVGLLTEPPRRARCTEYSAQPTENAARRAARSTARDDQKCSARAARSTARDDQKCSAHDQKCSALAGSVYKSFTELFHNSSSSTCGERAQSAQAPPADSAAAAGLKVGELRAALLAAGVGEPTLTELAGTQLTTADVRRINADRLSRGKGVGALVMDLRGAAKAAAAQQAQDESARRLRAEREAAAAAAADRVRAMEPEDVARLLERDPRGRILAGHVRAGSVRHDSPDVVRLVNQLANGSG